MAVKISSALLLVFCLYVSLTYSKRITVNFSGLVGEFCGASSTPGCTDQPPCTVPSQSPCPTVCVCPNQPQPSGPSPTPSLAASQSPVSQSPSRSVGASLSVSPSPIYPSGCPVCPPCVSFSTTSSNSLTPSVSRSNTPTASTAASQSTTRTSSVSITVSFTSSFTPSPSPHSCLPYYEASASNNQFGVGLLFARSNWATSAAAPGYYGALYAISQINAAGGIRIGSQNVSLVPQIVDTQGLPNVTVDAVNNLVGAQCSAVLVGTETSAERKTILPILESNYPGNAASPLLLAPFRWEGAENSSAVVHFGPNLAQNVIPALQWAIANGRTNIHLIGSDDIDSRVINAVARQYLSQFSNVTIIGEDYLYVGTAEATASQTYLAPQLVGAHLYNAAAGNPCPATNMHCYLLFSSVFGQGANRNLFQALAARYLNPNPNPTIASYQVLSLRLTEYEVLNFTDTNTNYQLLAANYFHNITGSLPQGGNGALAQWQSGILNFVNSTGEDYSARLRGSFVTSAVELNAYNAVMMWANVVSAAGTANPSTIKNRMVGASYNGPTGTWTIGPDRDVQTRSFYIGQLYHAPLRNLTNTIIYTQNNLASNLYPSVGNLNSPAAYASLENTINSQYYAGTWERLSSQLNQD